MFPQDIKQFTCKNEHKTTLTRRHLFFVQKDLHHFILLIVPIRYLCILCFVLFACMLSYLSCVADCLENGRSLADWLAVHFLGVNSDFPISVFGVGMYF